MLGLNESTIEVDPIRPKLIVLPLPVQNIQRAPERAATWSLPTLTYQGYLKGWPLPVESMTQAPS
jgi:hypothetical protein